MSNTALPNQRNKFRIKAVDEKAYLYYEQPEKTCVASAQDSDSKSLSDICVEISRPVTKKSLENSRLTLLKKLVEEKERLQKLNWENVDPKLTREIKLALGNSSEVFIGKQVTSVVNEIVFSLFQLLAGLIIISLAYKGVQFSQQVLNQSVHVLVLIIYSLALIAGVWSISTEKNRWKMNDWVRTMFGPRGWLLFAALLLVTSATVFASFTFIMYSKGWVALSPGDSKEISVAALLDFYMWHFTTLIPLIDFNDIVMWEKPLLYTQSRVGFLILLFQACVVLPAIASIRFYLKHRDVLSKNSFDFVC